MSASLPSEARGDAFRRRLGDIMAIDPGAPAIEFECRWNTWADLSATVDVVARAFASLSIEPGELVGVLLRNRPASIGMLLGVLRAGSCVVVLNPLLGSQRVSDDVADLDLRLILGEPTDLDSLTPDRRSRVATLAISALGDAGPERPFRAENWADLTIGRDPSSARPQVRPGTAIRLLTSGTTGPPKRVDLTYQTFERVLEGAKHYETQRASDLRLREGVVVVNSPLVHLGGLFRVLQSIMDGRRIALLERFTVPEWVDRVRRHRPKTASLVPTALRMVLDADVDPADLASLKSIISGTAPLSPETAEAFTDKYGVAVLTNYAATEFGGGVAGWNLADHQRYWSTKRGSVGRAHPGCALRVVDDTSGAALEPGQVGLLEVRADQLADAGWVRTTDLARLDEDGFLWIVGRADQTILRGGLKVQPDTVRHALERHPAVRAASVVGVDDDRLGQVPVAVVELTESGAVDKADLLAHAAQFLARYEIPVDVIFVDAMPRTESAKVDLRAVRALVLAAAPPAPAHPAAKG
ncbi:MAG: fatty acid--CoA ligase family protein [Acidimicrobiales bacterium]